MNRHIVFTESVKGHMLEYVNHIYNYAVGSDDTFVFVLPKEFDERKHLLSWRKTTNISIRYLSNREERMSLLANRFKRSWNICRIVLRYIKEEKVNSVFFITLINIIPFYFLLIPTGIKIDGIIYKVFLYEKNNIIRKMFNNLIYKSFTLFNCFRCIYLLNDTNGVHLLNKKYKTNKYCYLPDPVPNIDVKLLKNIRKEYNIPEWKKVFLLFGALEKRKNTINILKALNLMSNSELKNIAIIFAGRLLPEIESEFKLYVNKLKDKLQIVIIDGFIPYELLNNLCYSSDCILTIYTNTAQSSGTIGYAGFLGKPVIAPSYGLLGDLIKEYSLGYTLDIITPETIKSAMLHNYSSRSNDYRESHTVEQFCRIIFDNYK